MTKWSKEQIGQEWEAHDRALIECAKQAWAQDGAGYELLSWETHSLTAVVAYGQPPRAKSEYQHVFLFEKPYTDQRYHLRTIGKARWDRSIGWFGVCLTAKSTFYKCFPVDRWIADRPPLPAFDARIGS